MLKLNESDPVVRNWLIKNMRFMLKRGDEFEEEQKDDDEDYFKKALAIGMDREDLVVRRLLIQKMKTLLPFKDNPMIIEPTLEEIKNYQKENLKKFSSPPLIKLTQVFFKKKEAALKNLKKEKTKKKGDPFHMGADLTLSKKEIEKSFGKKFYQGVSSLKSSVWAGPVLSHFGYHLVRVEEVIPAKPHPLYTIKKQVRLLIVEERKKKALSKEILNLRRHYDVVLEEV